MYICHECGHIFTDSITLIERHGLDAPPYEYFEVSPCCQSNYTEAFICDKCGEYIDTETYVEIENNRYCENCFIIKNIYDDI